MELLVLSLIGASRFRAGKSWNLKKTEPPVTATDEAAEQVLWDCLAEIPFVKVQKVEQRIISDPGRSQTQRPAPAHSPGNQRDSKVPPGLRRRLWPGQRPVDHAAVGGHLQTGRDRLPGFLRQLPGKFRFRLYQQDGPIGAD